MYVRQSAYTKVTTPFLFMINPYSNCIDEDAKVGGKLDNNNNIQEQPRCKSLEPPEQIHKMIVKLPCPISFYIQRGLFHIYSSFPLRSPWNRS